MSPSKPLPITPDAPEDDREPTLCEHCEMDHPPFTACPACEDPHDAMVLPGTWSP